MEGELKIMPYKKINIKDEINKGLENDTELKKA